jgi:hypothetical protein
MAYQVICDKCKALIDGSFVNVIKHSREEIPSGLQQGGLFPDVYLCDTCWDAVRVTAGVLAPPA